MTVYRQISDNVNEIRFADPDQRFNTVSAKVNVQPKKAGSKTVYNAKSSINVQRTVVLPVDKGCDPCTLNQERLSGTVTLSGSTQSKAEMASVCNDLRALLTQFEADLLAGYLPQKPTVDVDQPVA